MMKDAPDHLDADLILKLYDLRREASLREARSKLTNEFLPKNAKEAVAVLDHGHPLNRAYRQVSTYWEMVYGMARFGVYEYKSIIPDLCCARNRGAMRLPIGRKCIQRLQYGGTNGSGGC